VAIGLGADTGFLTRRRLPAPEYAEQKLIDTLHPQQQTADSGSSVVMKGDAMLSGGNQMVMSGNNAMMAGSNAMMMRGGPKQAAAEALPVEGTMPSLTAPCNG
jgi:hypothetical protein